MTYTIYDAHTHIYSDDPDEALEILEVCGIAKAIIMNKGYGKERPNHEHQMWEEVSFKILEKYPERFAVFSTLDFSEMDETDLASRAAAHFEETIHRGASGLKLWLGKPDHHWMALHDPRSIRDRYSLTHGRSHHQLPSHHHHLSLFSTPVYPRYYSRCHQMKN